MVHGYYNEDSSNLLLEFHAVLIKVAHKWQKKTLCPVNTDIKQILDESTLLLVCMLPSILLDPHRFPKN
jgi:hypothetical protein